MDTSVDFEYNTQTGVGIVEYVGNTISRHIPRSNSFQKASIASGVLFFDLFWHCSRQTAPKSRIVI